MAKITSSDPAGAVVRGPDYHYETPYETEDPQLIEDAKKDPTLVVDESESVAEPQQSVEYNYGGTE